MPSPAYCATSVPKATPSTFIFSTNTKNRLAAILTMFWVMAMNIGKREFCMPMYHPVKP